MALLELLVGERRASLAKPPLWLQEFFGGTTTATGIRVDPDKAMRATAIHLAVKLLAEGVASLPLLIYQMGDEDSRRRDRKHHLWSLLRDTPNRWQTSLEFREMMQGHVLLRGNAYAGIIQSNAGRIEQLVPMHPDRVRPFWAPNGSVAYEFTPREGERRILLQDEVMHVRGMCLDEDCLKGLSPIEEMREAVALTLAAEEFGGRRYSNDARPSGVLTHPSALPPDQASRLREEWEARHTGLAGAHRVAVLEGGMKWEQIGLTPNDAQWIESRKFQVTEIARIFNIPPHKLKDLERATFSNIEQQNIEWVVDSLRPWLVRWEQVIHRDLFTPAERRTHFAEFLVEGLLRGAMKDRFESYAIGRNSGWLTANEIRRFENMNPIDGGDVLLIPLNMMPVAQAGEGLSARGSLREAVRLLVQEVSPETLARPVIPALQAAPEPRSLTGRRRLAQAFRSVFLDASERVVRKEVKAVRHNAKKLLGAASRSIPEFEEWLDGFYADFPEHISRAMKPVLAAYAEGIEAEAVAEVGGDASSIRALTSKMESFVDEYAEALSARHVKASTGQLRTLIRDDPEGALEAVTERLDSWEETRPGKIAARETIQAGGAFAKAAFAAAGVQKLVWRASAGACPLCEELDGQVVGIDQSFVRAGDTVDPGDGATAPLNVTSDVGHAPLHQGCQCSVAAG